MIDFERISQFLIFTSITSFCAFSPIIVPIAIFILSWFWSSTITLTLWFVYCCWLFTDRHTGSQGGRWSDWLRQCSIWTQWVKYFPLTLIKTVDLDQNRNYIFGYHPHGVG